MINKSYWCLSAIYGDATNDAICFIPRMNVSKGVAIHNAIVLYFKSFDGIDLVNSPLACLVNAESKCLAFLKNAVDVWSNGFLFWCEECIAAAASQTVFFTDDRAWHDFELESEVVNHASDDSNLLIVFLSEICAVWFHHIEKLGNNLAYSIEMTWTARTFHNLVCWRV